MKINLENKYLLEKIVKNKCRKMETSSMSSHYQLAMHEKRFREIDRINNENQKMANRISAQNSVLRKTILSDKFNSTHKLSNKSNKIDSSR